MPEPICDDSGYFESAMSEDEDISPETHSGDLKVKRSPSITSIHSQCSRGSSQLWDGMLTPDESELRCMEDMEEMSFDSKRPSRWRDDNNEDTIIDISPVKRPSSPGAVAMEVRALFPDSDDRTCPLGKRSIHEIDHPQATERSQQRLKPQTNFSWSSEQTTLVAPFTTSEDPDVIPQGSNSATIIEVAHSDSHQRFFDKLNLAWGVLWEIARLVTSQRLQYGDIPLSVLGDLTGANAVAAPLVEQRLLPQNGDARYRRVYGEAFAKEVNLRTPWTELDREEEFLKRNPLSGLGCNTVHDDWYGGKVSFTARLRQKEETGKSHCTPCYYLKLDPPELSTSTRFMRRWGSRRFVRVRIPDSGIDQRDNGLLNYFKKDFVIHGRVFRPFYAKEHSVFLFELNCVYKHGLVQPIEQDGRVSFGQFLQWHNPMAFNKNQSLAKWCARIALGLSNSVPGVEIAAENHHEICDIYSPAGQAALQAGRKPDSKDVMTDGEGFINQATLISLKYKFNWDLVPSAIQYRLGGAKGLLLLHPNDSEGYDEPFRVWIRPSQKKITYDENVERDRAHLVLDVLRRSQLKYPARLSTQIIVNLSQNGVSYDVFERLMNDGLQDIAMSLTQWSGQFAMQNLWASIAGVNGSVIRARMGREAAGSSRMMGFSYRDKDDEVPEDEDVMELTQASSKAWWADEISGCPSTLEETVMVLLDAGFEPQACPILAMKLKEVFKRALNSYIEKYKIVVPHSAEAWIVPDPCDVLEAGEIFLKTSESIVGQDGLRRDHLLGDVLVTRHPCRVPSDMQKVRAVWKDELRKYCDVIIFSVRGERSLASLLGGGDYDGDTAHVIWEPSIVNAFRIPDVKFADPPSCLDDAFERDTMTVDDFLNKYKDQQMTGELQDYLLAAVKDSSLVGQYSNWHDTAVYMHGYEDDEAWRLAYMFCAVLDSSKTGKTVKPVVLSKDRLKYQGHDPEWKGSLLDKSPFKIPPKRQGELRQIRFIMDHLKEEGRKKYDHHMAEFQKFLTSARQQYKTQMGITSPGLYVDPALEAPWLRAMERAQRLFDQDKNDRMKHELEVIRAHVQTVRDRYQELFRQDASERERSGRLSTSPRKNGSAFTNKPIEQRQNIFRDLSFSFSQMPEDCEFIVLSPEDVRRCRASYAYILESEHREKRFADAFSRFPFDVAMRELGIIKAESTGSYRMVNSGFYSCFNVTGAIKSFRSADLPAYTYRP